MTAQGGNAGGMRGAGGEDAARRLDVADQPQ